MDVVFVDYILLFVFFNFNSICCWIFCVFFLDIIGNEIVWFVVNKVMELRFNFFDNGLVLILINCIFFILFNFFFLKINNFFNMIKFLWIL